MLVETLLGDFQGRHGYVDVTVNYAPTDPDNKGTVLWDTFYAARGGAGGVCCYSGSAMTWRFGSAVPARRPSA